MYQFFGTGHGSRKRLINIIKLGIHYSESVCNFILGLHAFSGCDMVSVFKGTGKIKPMELLLKFPSQCQVLAQPGKQWAVTDELTLGLEKFLCAVYGGTKKQDHKD